LLEDKNDIKEVLTKFHDGPLGGHQGVSKTYARIRRQYKWPGMSNDIRSFMKGCGKCQKNKSSKIDKMPMVITDTPSRPFEKVYMDIVGPLPISSSGGRYILTFQDNFSKFMACTAIPDAEAVTVAKHFFS